VKVDAALIEGLSSQERIAMKLNLIPKAVAAILLGGLLGWYIHHDYVRWSLRGRAAFLEYQTQRFDMYMASPRSIMFSVVLATLFSLGVFVVYELVAYGLSALVNHRARKFI
jgi:hypothetical protein